MSLSKRGNGSRSEVGESGVGESCRTIIFTSGRITKEKEEKNGNHVVAH